MQRLQSPSRSRSRRSSSGWSSGRASSTGATASGTCAGRRSSCTASSAAACWCSAAWPSTTRAGLPIVVPLAGADRGGGRAVRARRRDPGRARAARRHLRAVPGRPRRDHGPLLRVPRDRPDHRRAHRRASRPTGAASTACSSRRWRCWSSRWCRSPSCGARSTDVGGPGTAASSTTWRRRDGRAALGTGPAGARRRTARSSRRITSRRRPGSASCGRAAPRSMRRSRRTRSSRVVMPSGCGIGGDAFWLTWDAATGRQDGPQRLGAGRLARGCRLAPGDRADRAAAARPAEHHGPGRGPLVGRRPRARTAGCHATRSWPRPSSWHGTGSRPGTGSSTRSSGRRRWSPTALGPDAGFFAGLPSARPAVATRRAGPPAGAGGDARDAGSRRLRCLLRGRPRRPAGARARRCRGARSRAADLRDHTSTPTDADRDRLPRRPGHDPSAQQLGRRRARAARRSWRGSRHPAPTRSGRPASPTRPGSTSGIEAAKLAMADRDAYLTDPAFEDVPVERLLDPATPPTSPRRIDPRRAARPAASANPVGGGTIYLATVDARRQRGQPHRVELPRASGRASWTRRPGSTTRTAGSYFSLDPSGTRTSSRPASGRSTRCSPGCCSGTASPARGSSRARWAATPSRRSTPSSCRPSSMAGSTSRPPSRRRAGTSNRADHFAPPVDVRLEPRHAPGVAEALAAMGHPVTPTEPFDSNLGHEHAIELVDGGPAAPDGSVAAATDPRSAGLPAVW